ncbi:cupin domain-containing protein [Luteolibacter ambystomatis]|uniref:Cupin domain-containing protein n=1 Tax=Luteolibacter ambystomatis TaxID=2824561 RepID=A0A975PG83_9BACT|nr:cupin domain-containing protein [Luteolibacter ambystomatis]QUE52523.1 cupin domain-containing protein [Luteolibacter ambystomatis]
MRHFTCLLFLCLLPLSVHAEDAGGDHAYSKTITITPLMKTKVDADGKPIVWPEAPAEVSAVRVEIPPGAETGWHKHPVPCFAYVLEGELTVRLESGTTKLLKAGDAFAEAVNVMHNGTNTGKVPVKLVMFAAGQADKPYAEKQATDTKPR